MNSDFELQEDHVLGERMLGTLYAGRQRSTRRDVSITVLRKEWGADAGFHREFHREMALAAAVVHPSVVRTLGTGVWRGNLFYATERIDAKQLSDHLRTEKRLAPDELYRVAKTGAEALRAAERCALTPLHWRTDSLLLLPDGTIKATDLGLFRILDRHTEYRRIVRKAMAYASPERIQGRAPDIRSDIFALGVILYELATGDLPFDGYESPVSLEYQLLHAVPTPPTEAAPDLSREMERIILRCLSKRPADRYQTADEVLEEIRAAGAAPLAKTRVEDFEVHENQGIGQGGMGTLFRGRQRSLNREVAIKVIQTQLTGNADVCMRFQSEAELLAQVHDGNVVQVFGAGTWKGRPFYAMELVEGEDLSVRLTNGPPVSVREILDVAEGVGKALRALWKCRIVHRDIKPANIFLGRDGTVKVTDFGLATSVKLHPARSRFIMGTLGYISPEQGTGRDVDVRSDIYSLGIVLFELASGELPFACTGTPTSVIRKHRFDPPPSLCEKGRVPECVDAIIQQCMAKRPEHRYQTPDDLIESVQEARKLLSVDPDSPSSRFPNTAPPEEVLV